jgi:hypothetical protein
MPIYTCTTTESTLTADVKAGDKSTQRANAEIFLWEEVESLGAIVGGDGAEDVAGTAGGQPGTATIESQHWGDLGVGPVGAWPASACITAKSTPAWLPCSRGLARCGARPAGLSLAGQCGAPTRLGEHRGSVPSCDGSVTGHNSRGAVRTGGPMGIAECLPTVNEGWGHAQHTSNHRARGSLAEGS